MTGLVRCICRGRYLLIRRRRRQHVVWIQEVDQPSRADQQLPSDGLLLLTMLDNFNVSVLDEPITYARCEPIPWSDSPLSLPVYALPPGSTPMPGQSWVQTVLASGTSSRPEVGSSAVAPPMDVEDCLLLETGLPGCPYRFAEHSGQPFSDGNPAFGLQLHHPRFLEFVGAPESHRLLCRSPTFWMDQLGREQAMAAAVNLQRDAGIMLSELSSELMVLGIGRMVFPQAEVADLSPAPRAARVAKYMSAMGLWRPPTGPGDPGPVPASSCRSCEYCFPEDKLPPG